MFDPVTSTRVYVGTRWGVFRSDDAGETWTATPGLTFRVEALAVHPDSPEILYASVNEYGGTDDRGLFKTTTGGDHWERLNDGLGTNRYPVGSLVFDEEVPRRLYAGNYQGVFVSEDGGESWASLPSLVGSRLVVARVGAGRLYAYYGELGLLAFDLPTFADVSPADPTLPWIEALYAGGLTYGCATSPPEFCPDDIVTRAQAAIFVVRGVLGPGVLPPPATGGVFDDVPPASFAAAWIEQTRRARAHGGMRPEALLPRGIAATGPGGRSPPARSARRGVPAAGPDRHRLRRRPHVASVRRLDRAARARRDHGWLRPGRTLLP